MPTKRDYYEILEITREVGADEVKRAYRKGALKYHPDNYKGDKTEGEARFKELAEAYEVLSDPQKRQQYDTYGHEGLRGAGVHDFSSMGFGDIFSMFADILGGFQGPQGDANHGLDLETEIDVSLEEVATGVERKLEFERTDLCETCGGSGASPDKPPVPCKTCGGRGQVQQQVRGFFGMSVRVSACPTCRGRGHIVTDPCKTCRGTGRGRKKRTLTVHVPPGIREGQVVRVRGEGEPGPTGNHRGDLHCYITVRTHPLLQRRASDLVCRVPVSFSVAALGGTVKVPTLTGPEDLDVPAGTQTGEVLTMRGRGLPAVGTNDRGNQHVVVFVEVPKKLSRGERKILEDYTEKADEDHLQQRKSYLKTMKKLYGSDVQ